MFERFTERARRVVILAQEEARQLNHNYIGTEHLLLGLICEEEGVAAKTLESLGISLDSVREQVQEIIGRGQDVPSGHIPFTPRAKKVCELALREALQYDHNYIGTEHLLLGLIREAEHNPGNGVAARVIAKHGVEIDQLRKATKEKMGNPPERAKVEEAPLGLQELRIDASSMGLSSRVDALAKLRREMGDDHPDVLLETARVLETIARRKCKVAKVAEAKP